MIEADAIQKLMDLGDDPEVDIAGRHYTARKLQLVTAPLAKTLGFHTLAGLVGYVESDIDGIVLAKHVAHVIDPQNVALFAALDVDRQREAIVGARVSDEGFPFGEWQDQEAALIGLQTLFVDTEQRARLLKSIGTMTADEVQTHADDGVTQRVTAAAGVTLKDRQDLPSPIALRPFRTFREVEQPESLFVVRVKKAGERLAVALFEADGGAWKLEAVNAVAAWLRDKLADELVVLA